MNDPTMRRRRSPVIPRLSQTFPIEPPVRTNYFFGRLLTSEDFTREQEYHRASRRRLMLATLGPGIVSGLKITPSKHGGVVISPGYAIDRLGREVIVPAPVEVLPTGRSCRWVVLEYAEELIDPMPVLGGADPATHPVRFGAIRETYRLTLRPAKPSATEPSGAIVLGRMPPARRR